jgi:hypothetical protein
MAARKAAKVLRECFGVGVGVSYKLAISLIVLRRLDI